MDMSEIGSDWNETSLTLGEQSDNDYLDRLAREAEQFESASGPGDGPTLTSDDPGDAGFGEDEPTDTADARADRASDSDPDKSSDARADGYDRLAAAHDDLRMLVSALGDVSRQLAGLINELRMQSSLTVGRQSGVEDQLVLAQQIDPKVGQLKGVAEELVANGLNQGPDLAFSATAQVTALGSEVRYARKRYRMNRAWENIWQALKRIAPRLWSLISHLVKVKEWSVTGQVGTGVLGLA